MKTRINCLSVLSVVAAAALAGPVLADTSVSLPFVLNGGLGTRSATSVTTVNNAASYDWSMNITNAAATGLIFGIPTQMPLTLYGINPANLVAVGNQPVGAMPMTLFTRNYSFTDLGQSVPTYNFNVTLRLLGDNTVQTTVDVLGLTQFAAGGITGSPIPVPLTSINLTGMATATAVPAPGSMALLGLGGTMIARRRRKAN